MITGEIYKVREACKHVGHLLNVMRERELKGVNLIEIDEFLAGYMGKNGLYAATLEHGLKGHACYSLNDELAHGDVRDYILKDDDILSLDVSLSLNGYYGDACISKTIGECTVESKMLVHAARYAMFKGIEAAYIGNTPADIGKATEEGAIGSFGYQPFKHLGGHFIGKSLHMEPFIPGYWDPKFDLHRLKEGDLLTVEPIIVESPLAADGEDYFLDGSTIKTSRGVRSAQWEHTILITENGPEILTV